ncbi:MAG TPA: hypothetical protein VK020_05530, partial [Microlunatus sp.]|nr:hypothetical protein [Microlunatus sp.]
QYEFDGSGPYPRGQRPSLFGVAAVVDAVWLNNGFRLDQGTPTFVGFSGAAGGVSGLRYQGLTLDLVTKPRGDRVQLDGDLVTAGRDCRNPKVALGETVPLPTRCSAAPVK